MKILGYCFYTFILAFFMSYNSSYATGQIAGKVLDAQTGEALIGVNILIEGTTKGASTDLDGFYKLKNVESGEHTLIFSYISYKAVKKQNVIVTNDQTTFLDVALTSDAIEIGEVVVAETADLGFEGALLNRQKNSSAISDGLSAELISKSSDASTADALKRVSGITLMSNKFVYVRGTSERYSSAMLNGAQLPTTEVDKKSFAFDLIPSGIIENTIVLKTFTPDQPGEFGGGLVQVNTVEFPDRSALSLNYSTSYTSGVSFEPMLAYVGGNTDWLGIDDGTRKLPDSFPQDLTQLDFFQAEDRETYFNALDDWNHSWNINSEKAPINQSFGLSYRNILDIFGEEIGLVTSGSYKSKFDTKKIRTIIWGGRGEGNSVSELDFEGTKSNWNVFAGGILNLSYKISSNHKISLKNSYSLNSDNETTKISGFYLYHSQYEQRNELEFVSRELLSSQAVGESYFPELNGLKVKWQGSYAQTYRDEPDNRKYVYGRDELEDDWRLKLTVSPSYYGARVFTDLQEYTRGLNLDFELPVTVSKIKIGGSYFNSSRFYHGRLISIVSPGVLGEWLYQEPDSAFQREHFDYYSNLKYAEHSDGTNNYSSNMENLAFYSMVEIPFGFFNQQFRFIGGLRWEKYLLNLNTATGSGILLNQVSLDRNDKNKLFPSLNLIYQINENINLRIAYSKTINRPQLRELTAFGYFDFESMSTVRGNPELKSADLENYDVRFEVYPGINEFFSISPFYKYIKNPIEQAIVPTSDNYNETFQNAKYAKVWGFEVEARFGFNRISKSLSNFFLNTNYSRVFSEVEDLLSNTRNTRPLQGQSPYVVNVRLEYENLYMGTSISLLYNRFGERIVQAGISLTNEEDIYEDPRDMLDIICKLEIIDNLSMKLSLNNILNEDEKYSQYGDLQRFREMHSSYSIGFSYTIN